MRGRRKPSSFPTQELVQRGYAAQDHRTSVAEVFRRRDRGETVEVCAGCACELDVEPAFHAVDCKERPVIR